MSVCLTVTEGWQKHFDLETRKARSLATEHLLEASKRGVQWTLSTLLDIDGGNGLLDYLLKQATFYT